MQLNIHWWIKAAHNRLWLPETRVGQLTCVDADYSGAKAKSNFILVVIKEQWHLRWNMLFSCIWLYQYKCSAIFCYMLFLCTNFDMIMHSIFYIIHSKHVCQERPIKKWDVLAFLLNSNETKWSPNGLFPSKLCKCFCWVNDSSNLTRVSSRFSKNISNCA